MHDASRRSPDRVAQRVAQIIAEAQKPLPPEPPDVAAVRALAAVLIEVTADHIRRAIEHARRDL